MCSQPRRAPRVTSYFFQHTGSRGCSDTGTTPLNVSGLALRAGTQCASAFTPNWAPIHPAKHEMGIIVLTNVVALSKNKDDD